MGGWVTVAIQAAAQLELWSIALFLQFQLSSIFQILSADIVIVFVKVLNVLQMTKFIMTSDLH